MIMNRKLLLISGIVLMMVFTTTAIPIVAEANETITLTRVHIRAIGKFAICDDDEVLYGHIFIGFMGLTPIFNEDIEYDTENIRVIVMGGFEVNGVTTYRFLSCIIRE